MLEQFVPSPPGYSKQDGMILWCLSLVILLLTVVTGSLSFNAYSTKSSDNFFITYCPTVFLVFIIPLNGQFPLSITKQCLTLLVVVILVCSSLLFLFLLLGKMIMKQTESINAFFTNKTLFFLYGFLLTIAEFLMNLFKPAEEEVVLANNTVFIFGILFSAISAFAFFYTHSSISPGNDKVIRFIVKKVFLAPMVAFHIYFFCLSLGKVFLGDAEATVKKDPVELANSVNTAHFFMLIVFILLIGAAIFFLKDIMIGVIGFIILIGIFDQSNNYSADNTNDDFSKKCNSFVTISKVLSLLGIILIAVEIGILCFKYRLGML